ncbi:chemotaxis-specific protein-glutamate methyltransferase CheB, partial [candidate division KSB3 bacterium]|nr:chemotaxis-specific protein-glutamate methyltransferase CheB [candidate division KSB3 bacterium]MBD3324416.1 chemotaxis-specific protein-glutamate methyltransferase CheB [candidate division KSB3 bacterium]
MDGLKAVAHLMSTTPTPIIMISSLTQKGAEATIQALNLGAIDFIPKLSGYVSLDIDQSAAEIIAKIKLASKIHVVRTVNHLDTLPDLATIVQKPPLTSPPARPIPQQADKRPIVIIGCSTGGPPALNDILPSFPSDFPAPILVVQHMPEKFTQKLAENLNTHTALQVLEARDGMRVQRGGVYIAPGAYHMKITPKRTIALMPGDPEASIPRPSVDILMHSVANVYGKHAIGVILTGMGNDGAAGMKAIKDHHGATIAQDEDTSLVFGMPKAAIEAGCVDSIVPLALVAEEIMSLVQTQTTAQKGGRLRKK